MKTTSGNPNSSMLALVALLAALCWGAPAAAADLATQIRLSYEELDDGTHNLHFDTMRLQAGEQVTLIQGEALVDDIELLQFLGSAKPFDAMAVWLIGTFEMRRTCRNLSNLQIGNSQSYRLLVQNRIYELADQILRPGGWLQIVNRGEYFREKFLIDNLLGCHREQAEPTSLDAFDVSFLNYQEPPEGGVGMIPAPSITGRVADLSQLAMHSVLSRKPIERS